MHPRSFDRLIEAVDGMAVNVTLPTTPREVIAQQLVMLGGVLRMMRDRDADESAPPDTLALLHDVASRATMMDVLNKAKGI